MADWKLFLYDAFDPQRSLGIKGSLWAATSEAAQARLHAQGYTDISMVVGRKTASTVTVSQASLALFFRQLSVMLDSGTQLGMALQLSAFTDDRYLSGVVTAIGDQVASGRSLSAAMALFPRVFSPLLVGLISAAENSGQLSITLHRIADAEERQANLQSQLSSALAYPAFLTVSTLAMCGLFVFYILPMDQELFASLGVELPAITQFLVGIINAMKSPLGIVVELGLVVGLIALLRTAEVRHAWKIRGLEFLRRFAVTRVILDKSRASRMLQVMGLLLRGGSSADVALKFMGAASEDPRQKRLLDQIRQKVIQGDELSEALESNDLFPRMVVAMMVVGYEAGTLEEMCAKAADMCEEDVRLALDAATAMVEPVLMGFAGLIGGFVIISSAMPLLKLVEGL